VVSPPSSEVGRASASVPRVSAGTSGKRLKPYTMEPATGKGDQGNLERPPSRWTSDVWNWQTRQRNTRLPRHLTVAKESAVASYRKTPAARTDRTGKVLVTSVHCALHGYMMGSCVKPRPTSGSLREQSTPRMLVQAPTALCRCRAQRAQGRLGLQTKAMRLAILRDRARSPTQNREGHESRRVGNDASGRWEGAVSGKPESVGQFLFGDLSMVAQDTDLRMRRAVSASFRKWPKGLRTDHRLAQCPLEVQPGRAETSAEKTPRKL